MIYILLAVFASLDNQVKLMINEELNGAIDSIGGKVILRDLSPSKVISFVSGKLMDAEKRGKRSIR